MKTTLLTTVVLLLAASPALAARVTNLDEVPHVVTFTFAGDVRQENVAPGKTVYFPNLDGVISLKGGTPGTSSVTSDGLLQGVIGAARSSNIPASPGDDYVIWKGGKMGLQRRMKTFTTN